MKGKDRATPRILEWRRAREIARFTSCEGLRTASKNLALWHRDLPPVEAEALGEHTVEAVSGRVAETLAHRDELWDRCYADLMAAVHERLNQEIARLGGHFAHVLRESVDSRHDDATGQAWLRGCFTYVLYRRPTAPCSLR